MRRLVLLALMTMGAAKPAAPLKPALQKAVPGSQPASLPAVEREGPNCLIEINSSINPGSGAYIIQSIDVAKGQNCGLLIIALDTPGGLLQTTKDIVKALLAAPIPVVVFVSPPGAVAGSAGVFITLAANVAAMAPGTHIGAAHPVAGGGKDVSEEGGKDMAKKVENDAIAFIESIAQTRSRNKEWAIKAVRDSVSITAESALEQNVIDLIARDLPDLFEKLEGRVVPIGDQQVRLRTKNKELRRIGMSLSQRVTSAFADPQIAYLLMTFGVLGIIMELYHPGSIFPGVFGGICLLLAFISFQVLPINWGGVALALLGLGLFVAEIFVTSHGILGIAGGVAVVLGGLLLINTQDPNYFVEPEFALGYAEVLPVGLVLTGIGIFLASVVLKSRRKKPQSGQEGLVGEVGVTRQAIGPGSSGLVLLHGELWRAESEDQIQVGDQAEVTEVLGLTVKVRSLSRSQDRKE